MREREIGFFQYIKAQYKPQYRLTGEITGRDGLLYTERHYAGIKCAIDFVLLIAGATLMLLGFQLIARLVEPLYAPHTGAYDPHIGSKFLLRSMITGASTSAFFICIVPACMKLIGLLFSFRWLFVKFDTAEDTGKQAADVKYLEYYNNVTSFQCDRFGYTDSKKIKEIQDEHYQARNIKVINKWAIAFYRCLIVALMVCMVFALMNEGIAMEVLIYSGLVLIYCLSHVFTYLSWKKGIKRVVQAS